MLNEDDEVLLELMKTRNLNYADACKRLKELRESATRALMNGNTEALEGILNNNFGCNCSITEVDGNE